MENIVYQTPSPVSHRTHSEANRNAMTSPRARRHVSSSTRGNAQATPSTSHSFSRSWKSPAVIARERWTRVIKGREHICPESPFLTRVFDWQGHRTAMDSAWAELNVAKAATTLQDHSVRKENVARSYRDCPQRVESSLLPFHGRVYSDSQYSSVLFQSTIWVQDADKLRKYTAPWPSIAEMKYDGEDRIGTDRKFRRFAPHPRYQSDVPGKSWTEIDHLPPDQMDKRRPFPDDLEHIQFAMYDMPELEIKDQDGERLLGASMMDLWDSQHIWMVDAAHDLKRGIGQDSGVRFEVRRGSM